MLTGGGHELRWVTWRHAAAMPKRGGMPPDWEFMESVVAEGLRSRGFRFCGATHQSDEHPCVPVVDGWPYMASMRVWGDLMARTLGSDWDYTDWAWGCPESQEESLPEPGLAYPVLLGGNSTTVLRA